MNARDIAEAIDYHVALRAQRRRRWLRRHRGAERPRLPAAPVPLPQVQPPRRRVRREPREPDALRRRCAHRGAGRGRRQGRGGHPPRRRRRAVSHGPGLTADDCAEVAARYEELGLVDYFNVSASASVASAWCDRCTRRTCSACTRRTRSRRRCDHTPVFTVHRILDPEEAEGIIERHEADGITLVRALIADPEWVNKARDGRERRDPSLHRDQPGLLRQLAAVDADHLCTEPGRRA